MPVIVRKSMIAYCPIDVLNVGTRIDVLKATAGTDVVGATTVFDREIGQEEIVYRIQSLSMISARHWVR
jgi:hypothetical protein